LLLAGNLYHMVKAASFPDPQNQYSPARSLWQERFLLQWSVEEAGPAFVGAGLITTEQLRRCLSGCRPPENPDVLVLTLVSVVWARKGM
jgi:hypothetical protein